MSFVDIFTHFHWFSIWTKNFQSTFLEIWELYPHSFFRVCREWLYLAFEHIKLKIEDDMFFAITIFVLWRLGSIGARPTREPRVFSKKSLIFYLQSRNLIHNDGCTQSRDIAFWKNHVFWFFKTSRADTAAYKALQGKWSSPNYLAQ